MQRRTFIERVLRQVYGGQPSDDSNITFNLVNQWLNDAIGAAAKQNYTDSIKLEGISFVNNSFYTTYKNLTISSSDVDEFAFQLQLPHIPYGIGKNEGVETLQFKSGSSVSYTAIPLSIHQLGYADTMQQIPNKVLYWPEGEFIYVKTTLPLADYTATVRMISGGDSTDLSSTLNVPDDYMPFLFDYVGKELLASKNQRQDNTNDGKDNN